MYACMRVSHTGLDWSRPVCLGMYACMRVSQTGLDRSRPVVLYIYIFSCSIFIYHVKMTGIFFPSINLFFLYIYIRENYNFFLRVTLEYAHHIDASRYTFGIICTDR